MLDVTDEIDFLYAQVISQVGKFRLTNLHRRHAI